MGTPSNESERSSSPPAVRVGDLQPQQQAMVDLLAELVGEDTPVENKAVIDRMVDYLDGLLKATGAQTATEPMATTGNLLRAQWGDGEAAPILMLAHVDTVWPVGEVARRPFRVDGPLAYGPGVLDMKAGVVVMLFAMRALVDRGRIPSRPVVALINADEEVGSGASREAIEREARRSAAVLVLEPAMPNGALKTSRKGWGMFRLAVRGRAAHAGANPEQGISAIEELARQITYLHGLTDLPNGTSVNVGVIRGGTRPNVIAAEADAEIDIRTTSAPEMDRIAASLRELRAMLDGSEVELSGAVNRPPMERLAGNVALYERARSIANELGFDVGEATSGAASDGNFATALGIPTLDGLGAVGVGPHAVEEMIEVASLVERSALLASLLGSFDG